MNYSPTGSDMRGKIKLQSMSINLTMDLTKTQGCKQLSPGQTRILDV